MTAMERLAKLEQQFTTEQARVILDAIEEQTVTKDYLDARLATLKVELTVWMVGLTLALLAAVTGFGLTILNRLATLT